MNGPRILIVEDEAISAKCLEKKLKSLGYYVGGIEVSGPAAVDKATGTGTHPDLILMDIILKGEMDGIQAAAKIRETRDIPVIYLSASSDERTLTRALTTGPFGYLLKPVQDSVLRFAIEVALSKHRTEKSLYDKEQQLREQAEELKRNDKELRQAICALKTSRGEGDGHSEEDSRTRTVV